jgi:hypothetical protein
MLPKERERELNKHPGSKGTMKIVGQHQKEREREYYY